MAPMIDHVVNLCDSHWHSHTAIVMLCSTWRFSQISWQQNEHNTETQSWLCKMDRPGETQDVSRSPYSIIAIQGIARIMYDHRQMLYFHVTHHMRHDNIIQNTFDTNRIIAIQKIAQIFPHITCIMTCLSSRDSNRFTFAFTPWQQNEHDTETQSCLCKVARPSETQDVSGSHPKHIWHQPNHCNPKDCSHLATYHMNHDVLVISWLK